MELSNPSLIEMLLATEPRQRRPRTVAGSKHQYGTDQQRCRCGRCNRCVENARWERIFKQKFEDPDYYKRSLFRGGSSLSWLR
jgi:hypothetical protein